MTTTLRRIPPLERAGAFVEGIGHAVSFRLQDAYAVFAFHRRPHLLRRANERNFRRFDASWRACKGVPVQVGEPRAFRSGKPRHRVRRLKELVQWMDAWLKPQDGPAAAE